MTPWRWSILSFWVVISVILLWQFYAYNQELSKEDATRPEQPHLVFLPGKQLPPPPPKPDAPDVRQTAFTFDDQSPTPNNFVAHITLKNLGTIKAVKVQVDVRPYHGKPMMDVDVGHTKREMVNPTTNADDSPLAQYGQWVEFPDLAPGQSVTENATFFRQNNMAPGYNLDPQIIFQADKPRKP